MTPTARDFYQGLRQSLYNLLDNVRPWRGKVNSSSSGLTTVIPDASGEALDESFARVAGFKLSSNDEVMMIPFGGSHIVVGEIERSIPASRTLDSALVVEGEITATSFNSPFVRNAAQSSSDSTSTTSTANFSAAITLSVPLPTGTWTIYAQGGVALIHSAGGSVNFQVNIDAIEGSIRTLSMSSTVYGQCVSDNVQTGRSGTINVTVRFKSSTAGTTSARNPWLFVVAVRTS